MKPSTILTAIRANPGVGWLAAGACVVGAFFVVGAVANAISPSPSGPALSSYATTPQGVGAWAELLSRDGHAVAQLRTESSIGVLPRNASLVILAGRSALATAPGQSGSRTGLDGLDVALQRFLNRGGRVVLGGQAAAFAPRFHGAVIAVPDPAFLENNSLGRSDNAFRALTLVGDPSRPVYFDEALHGYGPASGLSALPQRWWFAIIAFGLALVAWALSRAVRLGGSDPVPVPEPSPRAAYIEAMARSLERAANRDELAKQVNATLEPGSASEAPVKMSAR